MSCASATNGQRGWIRKKKVLSDFFPLHAFLLISPKCKFLQLEWYASKNLGGKPASAYGLSISAPPHMDSLSGSPGDVGCRVDF